MGTKPTVISLYTGAGGLDYGFEAAGFKTSVAIEVDHDSCETLRANRRWPVIERDIHNISSEEILKRAKLHCKQADVLIGGPPCQPFSKSGYWASGDAGRLQDPRAGTLEAYLRVLEDTQPKAFLLENVAGMAYTGKSEGLDFILRAIRTINRRTGANYRPVFTTLRAAEYGVPQMRERFFMIAGRDGQSFSFPETTHGSRDRQIELRELEPYRTAWDALGDVAPDKDEDVAARGKWADLLPSIPEGENYLWHTERGGGLPLFGWRRRFWSFLLKLAKDRPSWTLQAQPGPATGPFHWKNRRLSMREMCRIQTFPDDVHIVGGGRSVQRQVGNAVPSLLAEILGREIRRQLLGMKKPRGNLKLLPPVRTPVPKAERVRAVPEKFQELKGHHEAHPGTGKGYRAARWQESSSVTEAPSDATS